jgi:signal recognition particle subunit SRP68
LARIRKRTGMQQGKVQGKRRFYRRYNVKAAHVESELALWIPLFLAERAWSHAQELSEVSDEHPRAKFQARARLRKATVWSAQFFALCSARGDARTVLEADAYHHQMQARLHVEQAEWRAALQCLMRTKAILDRFVEVGDHALRDLCAHRLREVTQSIRLAKYNGAADDSDGAAAVGTSTAVAADKGEGEVDLLQMAGQSGPGMDALNKKLAAMIVEEQQQQASSMSELRWRGQVVTVSVPKLRVALVNLEALTREVEREQSPAPKLRLFDRLLMAYADAQQQTQATVHTLEQDQRRSNKGEARLLSQRTLLLYLQVMRVSHTLKRNLCLVGVHQDRLLRQQAGGVHANVPASAAKSGQISSSSSSSSSAVTAAGSASSPATASTVDADLGAYVPRRESRAADLVRLYDNVMLNQNRLIELRQQDDVEEGLVLAVGLAAYKAQRAFYMALAYAEQGGLDEALALLQRAEERAADALRQLHACAAPQAAFTAELGSLRGAVRARRAVLLAERELTALEHATPASAQARTMLERVDEYSTAFLEKRNGHAPTIVEFPPAYEMISSNPFLFDLALSALDYPNLEQHLEQPKKKGGFWGFWRS